MSIRGECSIHFGENRSQQLVGPPIATDQGRHRDENEYAKKPVILSAGVARRISRDISVSFALFWLFHGDLVEEPGRGDLVRHIAVDSSPKRGAQNDRVRIGAGLIPKLLVCCLLAWACSSLVQAQTESKLDYTVTLADASHHRAHVSMTYDPQNGGNEVQMPVWNATYQVRDFSRNVIALRASSQSGEQLAVREIDKATWEFHPSAGWVTLDYDIILDEPGPFGAQFNLHHAFLNLAEVLMYPTAGRELPITVRFEQAPPDWKLATALPSLSIPAPQPGAPSAHVLHAANYDRLVDSPCELGKFAESDFEQGGAKYRVVIDADPADYQATKLVDALKKIVSTETAWMDDRPFDNYVFIYHFPRGLAGGGMEHAYSTAIDHSARDLQDLKNLESTTAHEFFHLWNVKRIRPQSLEPIDYSHENYTRALWFSEGVTSTVADLVLVKAGLLKADDFLLRLSGAISILQSHPARLTQSAEESSLDAWLEKYPNYRAPERSISYYNKGELLGVLLDLQMRQDSHGRYSLRDLFQEMNRDYAKQGKFFPDSEGVRAEAEKLTGTDLHGFFNQYVSGTEELPYERLFSTVGLTLGKETRVTADPGFSATRSFSGPMTVEEVYGEEARNAGLQEGDEVVTIDGNSPGRSLDRQLATMKPGTKIRISVVNQGVRKDLEFTLGERSLTAYVLSESPGATPAQLARRRAWMESEDETSANVK
jgi:predicted metalloprotease with PDZ domain